MHLPVSSDRASVLSHQTSSDYSDERGLLHHHEHSYCVTAQLSPYRTIRATKLPRHKVVGCVREHGTVATRDAWDAALL
jgi:hypothetical protein